MSFEWRTDEDGEWQEEATPQETAVSQSFWQRRWHFLLVALLGIVAVWGVVQWQINQRIATATVEIESELLATHNFVLQTAVDQDETLFKANLSGSDPGWGEVQKRLLNEGLLLDRPMLGWQHEAMPDQLTAEAVTVTLDATFNAAELVYPQTYVVLGSSGLTGTVTLQQTAVYRLGERRWLYAPPLDDFWGDWITQGGDYLTVAYPERDRDVAARLAIHLDELLGQMCKELADLNCGNDLRVHLRLDTDPESLLTSNEIETMLTAGLRLELPAPTLIGLPTDEASYEALYRAYGVQLATAVLAHQIDYDCCRHQLFFRALRDYQLAQLDLQAWPLDQAMYGQILQAGFDGNVLSHWTRRWEEAPPQFLQVWLIEDPDPIWQQVYMLVEFLNEQETAVSPTQMMRLMNRNSYNGWLGDVLPSIYDPFRMLYSPEIFQTQFIDYIYEQSIGGQQAEPPIPFPDGEITLICDNGYSGFNNRVYAYDLASQTWDEKLTNFDISTDGYLTTYDGKNFILTENIYADTDTTTNRFYLLTEDKITLLEEIDLAFSSEHYVSYYIFNGPTKYLVRYESEQEKQFVIIRSLDCPTGDCPGLPFVGFPSISPNGQYVIENVPPAQDSEIIEQNLLRFQYELSVVSVNGELRRPVGLGGFSFWLDDNTYGFVRTGDDGWELVAASLSQQQPYVLLREVDLLEENPSLDESSVSSVNPVLALPNGKGLIVQALDANDPDRVNHIFRLQLTEDLTAVSNMELLWEGMFSGGIGYSPDGRYLMLVEYNHVTNGQVPYYLFDLETLQISEPFVSLGYNLSWSPDGQWFVQSNETYLLLHAPAYDYQYFIPSSLGNCTQVILSVDE